MLEDPIVEEARKVRNAHAKKFNYNLAAIAADLQAQQSIDGRKSVTFAPRKPQVIPTHQKIEPVIAEKPGEYKA